MLDFLFLLRTLQKCDDKVDFFDIKYQNLKEFLPEILNAFFNFLQGGTQPFVPYPQPEESFKEKKAPIESFKEKTPFVESKSEKKNVIFSEIKPGTHPESEESFKEKKAPIESFIEKAPFVESKLEKKNVVFSEIKPSKMSKSNISRFKNPINNPIQDLNEVIKNS